jgi:ParB-like chromosome segregation protein Spo0J
LRVTSAAVGETGEADIRLIRLRYRENRSLGDIRPLASSIRDEGLLHPVTISPVYALITGKRRLAAYGWLGRPAISYRMIGTVAEALDVLAAEDDGRQALPMTIAEAIYLDWQIRAELEWWPKAGHNKGDRAATEAHRARLAAASGLNATQYTRAREIILAAHGLRAVMNYLRPLGDDARQAAAAEAAKLLEAVQPRAVAHAYVRYRTRIPDTSARVFTPSEVDAAIAQLSGLALGFRDMQIDYDDPRVLARQDQAFTTSLRILNAWRRTRLRER